MVGLHLLPLISPDVEVPHTVNISDAAVEKADNLYARASYKEAIQNYYFLAQKGDAYAQYKTGMQYFYGEGIKKDRCESTYWFDKSARAGNRSAQIRLAMSYYYGFGVEQNNVLAYLWLRTAIGSIQNDETDSIKSFYKDIQKELKKNKKLDFAVKQFQFWQYEDQQPVEIHRLRKIPVFDQFLGEIYNTLPCN